MIPDDLIQQAIINKILSDNSITSILSNLNPVKEDQNQDSDFLYPGLRVDVNRQTPVGDGTDREKISLLGFSIYVISESRSSAECNKIGGQVVNRLFGSQIIGSNYNGSSNYFKMIRIDLVLSGKALYMADRIWQKEIQFETELHKL